MDIIRLSKTPEKIDLMADWFSSKWGIPREAYFESMTECIDGAAAVPEWYLALEDGKPIGGLGIIENDFHNRPDLTPNVCAVYTEPGYRKKGIAGKLLCRICEDMAERGIDTLYLLTDHTGFYERYGWEFFCMVLGDDEDEMSRMYIHRQDK